MASSTPYIWGSQIFPSFHGPDVRKTFLSHLRKQFIFNGITMFDDRGIERSQIISPELTQGIRESRISIVVLTKNYASSSWCLDELLEIFKCKEEVGQMVMTIFHGVDPSDVRKQTGEFGKAFKETCRRKTKEERRRWSQALTDVGNIAGEHFLNWDDESKMVQKIARDVSSVLDFEDVVGIEAHFEKMQSLLHLNDDGDGVMMVGITGPAGIGKTTIARALHSRLSSSFQLTCFMENIRGSYNSGLDDSGLKLCLQEELLSKLFKQNDMSIYHLGENAIEEWLCERKVLIILDGVDDLKQLEALANITTWFGPGSRIIVTTEDEELLKQHDINNIYHVDFPSSEEALQILCRYAFRENNPHNVFKELAESVVNLCGKLPLNLRAVGSSLRGQEKEEWENLKRTLVDRRVAEQVQRKRKSRYSTAMAFLVVINLLLEIASAVSDQLSSIRKPYFARISLVMSFLSVVLSILDFACKMQGQEINFRWKWPIPWFYYQSRGYRRIFGSYTDRVLLCCVVGQLIVSTINFSFTERRLDGPIKVSSVWPLFFAIGMVVLKFTEKTPISKEN